MPQTGTTNGHAHLYEIGDSRTQVFDDHDHSIPDEGNRTGPGGHEDHDHSL